jgi:hypothetical protein
MEARRELKGPPGEEGPLSAARLSQVTAVTCGSLFEALGSYYPTVTIYRGASIGHTYVQFRQKVDTTR